MTQTAHCPALLIAAPASGQGKTTVTAALARLFTRQHKKVRIFKCGPDFLDPKILACASNHPVDNVDLFLCGEADIRARLFAAAQTADLILVEGVMGLYDGTPSSAELARTFGLPVLTVINARAMAQTFAALAHGLAHYWPDLPFAGVFANEVGSPRHAQLLRDSLPPEMRWFGAFERDAAATLPQRHLGLMEADEIDDLAARLDRAADSIEQSALAALPPAVAFEAPAAAAPIAPLLRGRTIAIARDAAFGFLYPANLDCLHALGAELCFFSPLAGERLPACDALWLPGGYPELHAAQLAQCQPLWQDIAQHIHAGKAALAECGGLLCLLNSLTDANGEQHRMAAILDGEAQMQKRLAALGLQSAQLADGELRGHTFHYSTLQTTLAAAQRARTADGREGEAIYQQARLTASFVHFWFASNPRATAALFGAETT